jgi:CBS domain-containing protein
MTVYELCQRHVVTVRRHEDLTTAAWIMRERNVGCLVVVEPAGSIGGALPVGMLTDRDIVTNVIARDRDPHTLTVEDAMTRHPITLWAQSGIDEALLRLRNGGVRRAPVVDERGRLSGIIALDDVFEHLSHYMPSPATPIRREQRADPAPHPQGAASQPGKMGIERI